MQHNISTAYDVLSLCHNILSTIGKQDQNSNYEEKSDNFVY